MILLLVLSLVSCYEIPITITSEELKRYYTFTTEQNVKVKSYKDRGQGIEMQRSIKAGEIAFCVPSYLVIRHTDTFYLSKYIYYFSPKDKLIARILYEKFMGPRGSIINIFVHSFPTKLHNPYNWSDSLKGFFFKFMDGNFLNKTEQHRAFTQALENANGIDKNILKYESYVWALKIVESRSASTYDPNLNMHIEIFMPIIDFVNYWPSSNDDLVSFKLRGKEICLISALDRQKGEELFATYSSYNSLNYFLSYGITFYDYPYDYLKLNFNPSFIKNQINLYARNISIDLLEGISSYLGKGMKFKDYRSTIDNLEDREQYRHVISALKFYRKQVLNTLDKGKAGIRETRRLNATNYDEQSILNFVIANRKTFYRHKEAYEKEFTYTLFRKLF